MLEVLTPIGTSPCRTSSSRSVDPRLDRPDLWHVLHDEGAGSQRVQLGGEAGPIERLVGVDDGQPRSQHRAEPNTFHDAASCLG